MPHSNSEINSIPDDAKISAFPLLEHIMSSESSVERCLATAALGHVGGTASVEILLKHLHDSDPDVRADVAKALAVIGDRSAIAPVVENLREDPVCDLKAEYVKSLGALEARRIGDSDPELAVNSSDKNPTIDLLCQLVVSRGEEHGVAWDYDSGVWDDWLDVQNLAIETLGEICPPEKTEQAIAVIVKALNDLEGQDVWATAMGALTQLGDEGVIAMGVLHKDATSLQRKRMATALSMSNSNASRKFLEILSKDQEVSVRLAVVESAAKLGLADLEKNLIRDEDAQVRKVVLDSAKQLDEKAVAVALRDRDIKVKIAACDYIVRLGQETKSFNLVRSVERSLRKASAEILSALVRSCIVAEPKEAAILIEDIVNHVATDSLVRLACLRGLAQLNTPNAVKLLGVGAADSKQNIRLEAVVALGKLAKATDKAGDDAALVLANAITGKLIAVPEGWQPDDDNVVQFPQKKHALGDRSAGSVKLDREGNIIEAVAIPEEPVEVVVEDEIEAFAPQSTLDAIMAVNPVKEPTQSLVELNDDDLAYLELTGARHGRRRKSPEAEVPAHLDVSRLAARVAGETGRGELVAPLAKVTLSQDRELCEAGIFGLRALAQSGVNIAQAQPELLVLVEAANAGLRVLGVNALGDIDSDEASKAIKIAMSDQESAVRAASIVASIDKKGIVLNFDELANDARDVRLAAAKYAVKMPTHGLSFLLSVLFVEDGVHKFQVAGLMRPFKEEALPAIMNLIAGNDMRKRQIALEILPILLG